MKLFRDDELRKFGLALGPSAVLVPATGFDEDTTLPLPEYISRARADSAISDAAYLPLDLTDYDANKITQIMSDQLLAYQQLHPHDITRILRLAFQAH